jgi:hypothetical protein
MPCYHLQLVPSFMWQRIPCCAGLTPMSYVQDVLCNLFIYLFIYLFICLSSHWILRHRTPQLFPEHYAVTASLRAFLPYKKSQLSKIFNNNTNVSDIYFVVDALHLKYLVKYSRTSHIRTNWDGEPSG